MSWHTIPEHFDLVAFSVSVVSVSWYGLFFGVGLLVASSLFYFLAKAESSPFRVSADESFDITILSVVGMVLGARIGFAILYGREFFLEQPWLLVLPFDLQTGKWVGISGMSAYGGIIGAILGLSFSLRGRPRVWWALLDNMAVSAPLGIFFGRIGNFISGELFGRATNMSWAMAFPRSGDFALRHPSQLYEAFSEGIMLFLLLFLLLRKRMVPGRVFSLALIFYGGIRFWLEFYREPDWNDPLLLGWMTRGQLFSLPTIFLGIIIFWWLGRRESGILSRQESCDLDGKKQESPFQIP